MIKYTCYNIRMKIKRFLVNIGIKGKKHREAIKKVISWLHDNGLGA